MYVDEVGNSDLRASADPNHRYLSLTGVILEQHHVANILHPQIEELKTEFFNHHPDEPVILHRKELVNRKHPFTALRNAETEEKFNAKLIQYLNEWEYTVITVVIDKLQHKEKYQVWRYDPYHYCQEVLVERYVRYLSGLNSTGDVFAESRGGREDKRLKESFRRIHSEGTNFVSPTKFQDTLTSSQLKIKPKASNIAGLQLADLVAHPSYKSTLAKKTNQELPANFGGRIYKILEARKYYRSPAGWIDGWGVKWLP